MKKPTRFTFILALITTAFLTLAAFAEERILNYDVAITVSKDGSMNVVEKIQVRAEGHNIKRGIYRDFPVHYREKGGTRRSVDFDLTSVTRDGIKEPYFIKSSDAHKRIYIGQKSTYLKPGIYTYQLNYKTNRQLRFFEHFDELYWNVTGNQWSFKINHVRVALSLPENANILQERAFTGAYRQTGTHYQITTKNPSYIEYETTAVLQEHQGLTFAVGWQKGVINEPSPIAKTLSRILDNIGLVFLFIGTISIAAYYYFVWKKIGKDPENGPIIPLFSPPKGMSPAAVSYVHYRKFKSAGGGSLPLVAALVSMAVKKQISISETNKKITLTKMRQSKKDLPAGEKALFDRLLTRRDKITFEQSKAGIVQSARASFRKAISSENGAVYFNNNRTYFAAGLAASVITLLAYIGFHNPDPLMMANTLVPLVSGAAGSFILSSGLWRLWDDIPGGSSRLWGVVLTILGSLALLPALLMIVTVETDTTPYWVPVFCAALAIMNIVFFTLLHAPTELGQKVMDEIEGFKLYLSVAEAERLNFKDAPDVDTDTFERFLPYAIGLGVENPWSKAFENYMANVQITGSRRPYEPSWYHGQSRWNSNNLGVATAAIVSSVSAGMAKATPPSTSGSSGSGGGFSGGGGGGGGGGGW